MIMARLWDVLAVFLTASSVTAVEPPVSVNHLSQLVNSVWNEYEARNIGTIRSPMFSLAMSIPPTSDPKRYDVNQVIHADSPTDVRNTLHRCAVYAGDRMVEAAVLKYPDAVGQCPDEIVPWPYVKDKCPNVKVWKDFAQCNENNIQALKRTGNHLADHAEHRVLTNFKENMFPAVMKATHLMLYICRKSPCLYRCTDEDDERSILPLLPKIKHWNKIAYVFSEFYIPPTSRPGDVREDVRASLTALGNVLRLENIYRCTAQRCFRCSSPTGGAVSENCLPQTTSSG